MKLWERILLTDWDRIRVGAPAYKILNFGKHAQWVCGLGVSSMTRQDHVARNDKAHGPSEEDVARKVITCGNSREADGPSQAVGHERNPAMLPIPVGQHRRYGGCCHGVVRKESA